MNIEKIYTVEKNDINEEDRTITFVISTEDVDSDFDRVMVKGWNFDRAGGYIPFLPFHDRKQWPLGSFTKIWTDADKVYGTVKFATSDENPDGERAYRMYKAGHAKAVSVGFDAVEYQPNEFGGYDVKQSVLHEVSAVTVGANPKATAVKKALKDEDENLEQSVKNVLEKMGIVPIDKEETENSPATEELTNDQMSSNEPQSESKLKELLDAILEVKTSIK